MTNGIDNCLLGAHYHLYNFFLWNTCSNLLPIFLIRLSLFFIIEFKSSLWIFDTSSFSGTFLASIFTVLWLFNIFLMISDNNQTFYISVKSFFFSFMVISFHDTNIFCLTLNQKRSFHVFFPKFLALAGDFPGASDNKESACIAGDPSWSLRSGRSPGEGNDNSLQHSCLDRGAWWAAVYGVTKSQTWLSD